MKEYPVIGIANLEETKKDFFECFRKISVKS